MSNDTKSGSTSDLRKKLHGKQDENTESGETGGSGTKVPIEFLDHPSYMELQSKLTEAEKKAEQYFEKALRIQADLENNQRRTERDVANAHKYGLEKFVSELLPIIDNLERTIDTATEKHTPEAILEGVKMTLKLFYSAMEKFGVKQVNPENQAFNPEFHQAISTQADDSVAPGTVLNVMQKGYLLHGRLVRPALVVVSKS